MNTEEYNTNLPQDFYSTLRYQDSLAGDLLCNILRQQNGLVFTQEFSDICIAKDKLHNTVHTFNHLNRNQRDCLHLVPYQIFRNKTIGYYLTSDTLEPIDRSRFEFEIFRRMQYACVTMHEFDFTVEGDAYRIFIPEKECILFPHLGKFFSIFIQGKGQFLFIPFEDAVMPSLLCYLLEYEDNFLDIFTTKQLMNKLDVSTDNNNDILNHRINRLNTELPFQIRSEVMFGNTVGYTISDSKVSVDTIRHSLLKLQSTETDHRRPYRTIEINDNASFIFVRVQSGSELIIGNYNDIRMLESWWKNDPHIRNTPYAQTDIAENTVRTRLKRINPQLRNHRFSLLKSKDDDCFQLKLLEI